MTCPSTDEVEFIFLGTGASSSLPLIDCLTAPPGAEPCPTCTSTLCPSGKKNIRRNTSAAVRMKAKTDGRLVTIVVDAGKTFQAAALEWFPKFGLRRIDAVLITHAHADAMNGLDDLRAWTLDNTIQPYIDIYLSETTFDTVRRTFPYLVCKELASGGGAVADFKWHIIEDRVPFQIQDTGIQITPFSVHHGRVFATDPPSGGIPTPGTISPSTPSMSGASSPLCGDSALRDSPKMIHPYISFGFKFGGTVVYISDVSDIPDDSWSLLEEPSQGASGPLPVFICDCLGIRPHSSHMHLHRSVATAVRIGASRTYLTGFAHEIPHDRYVLFGEAIERDEPIDVSGLPALENQEIEQIGQGQPIWLRPSFDGLRVVVSKDGTVRDTGYD